LPILKIILRHKLILSLHSICGLNRKESAFAVISADEGLRGHFNFLAISLPDSYSLALAEYMGRLRACGSSQAQRMA
jgi:hypothetical protein